MKNLIDNKKEERDEFIKETEELSQEYERLC